VGDGAAEQRFEHIYRAHSRAVYAYFLRRTDPGSAQDGTAETFLVAWRRLAAVPEGEATLFWLYATARRVLANSQRATRRFARLVGRVAGLGAPDPPRPDTIVLRREADQEVLDALSLLRPAEQELLRLAVWEEVPRDRLAEMYGCTPHAASERISRATARLARHLPAAGHTHDEAAPPDSRGGNAE